MNKMRLIRDTKWFFQTFPYFQMHMDNDLFKGWVSINDLTDGEERYWEYKKAGKIPVCGKGMTWLTLIPDDRSRCIGTYILQNRRVSTWYVDVIENTGIDEDGMVYYIDKYLDVLFSPQGDVYIQDRDELEEAYESGELSKTQYENALREVELIVEELTSDVEKTEKFCLEVLKKAEEMIADDKFTIFLDIDGVLDIFDPKKEVQELLPQALFYLKDLVHRTRAEVVIISDWRYGSPEYREKAVACGYGQRVALWDLLAERFSEEQIEIKGITPWGEQFENRAMEIKAYLEEHSKIRRYVILDDCYGDDYSCDEELKKHLVFVDALKGLQKPDLIEACRIMNLLK